MRILSNEEMKLLEQVQSDFPLTRRPFRDIGKRAGLTEQDTIISLEKLKKEDYIREISILINAGKIGYKSTLVALKADESEMRRIIPRINAHCGVSHNYLRDASFNIWFTLTIPVDTDYNTEVALLLNDESLSFLILPSLRIFKIGVKFGISGKNGLADSTMSTHSNDKVILLSEFEKEMIRKLQIDFPMDPEPWSILAKHCSVETDLLLEYISTWKKLGIIKRIAAFLRHRNLGYIANGMACYNIPTQDIQKAGYIASQYEEVSHCYQRPVYNQWPYSIYTMVHCKEKKECDSIITRIAKKMNCNDYRVLYSSKELKKERVKYLMEEK